MLGGTEEEDGGDGHGAKNEAGLTRVARMVEGGAAASLARAARADAGASRAVGAGFEVRPPVVETCGPSSPRAVAVATSPSPSTALPEGRCGFASSAAGPSMPCSWTNGKELTSSLRPWRREAKERKVRNRVSVSKHT